MSVQKYIQPSRLFILMYYLNIATQKISLFACMYTCIHHNEIPTAVKKKKRAEKKHPTAMSGNPSFIHVSVVLS